MEGEREAGEVCRLCGAQEGKMLHLADTFSILGATSTILHLLQSVSVFLKVQSECESLMPHHLCWSCFNTAIDINAFIDSGINFQRTTVNHLLPSLVTRVEETPCHPILLPFSAPDGGSAEEVVLQGELEEGGTGDQSSATSVLVVTSEEVELVDKSRESQCVQNQKPEDKLGQDSGDSTQPLPQVNQTPEESENLDNAESKRETEETLKSSTQNFGNEGEQHLGTNQSSGEETSRPVIANEKEKKCVHCSKTFLRQSQLKSHLASHSQSRPHQCPVCGVGFKHRRNLVEHSHTHSQRPAFICAVCGLTFKQKSNLLKHERTHRTGRVQGYRCQLCGNQYSQSSHLKTHLRIAHGDNHGHRCEECSAVLVCRSSLRRHLATVHASATRFTCPHCSKGFNNHQNYQGHVRGHTGERPYSCPTCSKTFTTPKALSRHRLVHQGARTHKCTQCGKAFLELCDLKRHTKRHLLKAAKRTNSGAVARCQESAADPQDPGIGSINLMVLTDSLLFTESQQLLENPEPRPDQVILPHGKLDSPKDVTAEAVIEAGTLLEASDTEIHLAKKPHVEVLAPSPLLPSTPGIDAVLQPPVIGDMAPPLHSGQILQPTNIEVEDGADTSEVDLGHRGCPGCPAAPEVPTMVVLASARTPSEFLPDPEPQAGSRATSPVSDVGERVLSHATW